MRHSTALLSAALLTAVSGACSTEPVRRPPDDVLVDAGERLDAGHEVVDDAGLPDAGEVDAGHEPGPVDAGTTDAGTPTPGGLASEVKVHHVALFQAVKVPLVRDGVSQAPSAPVIAGRAAVMRVYVEGSMTGLQPRLEVWSGAEEALLEPLGAATSAPDEPGVQAFEFAIPATFVQPDLRYAVSVLEPDGGEQVDEGVSHSARYPRDGGDASLNIEPDPGPLKIMLVPVRYDTDGSGRLPDTSPAQLDRMRELLAAVYPTTEVQLEVREAIAWSQGLIPVFNNFYFGALNNTLADLRQSDGAPDDVYYYGLVSPGESRSDYCNAVRFRGCVTGQSWAVDDVSDADIRAGSGVGFAGEDSVWTLIHEVGHMHGRYHAPCSTSGDDDYPHPDGLLGTWGYDETTGDLIDPEETTDFMGYCSPTWVSDYTWAALHQRITALNAHAFRMPASRRPTLLIDISAQGEAHVDRVITLSEQLGQPGVPVTLQAADGSGRGTVESRLVPKSHDGVTLFVPEPPPDVAWLEFTLSGVTYRLPR